MRGLFVLASLMIAVTGHAEMQGPPEPEMLSPDQVAAQRAQMDALWNDFITDVSQGGATSQVELERERADLSALRNCKQIALESARHCENDVERAESTMQGMINSALDDLADYKKANSMRSQFKHGKDLYRDIETQANVAFYSCRTYRYGSDDSNGPSRNTNKSNRRSDDVCRIYCGNVTVQSQKGRAVRDSLFASCDSRFNSAEARITKKLAQAKSMQGQYQAALKRVTFATAGAASAALLANELDSKSDRKREKRRAAEEKYNLENGIVVTEDGKKIQCLTPTEFQRPECRETLFRHCQGDNATGVGCVTFNNYFCMGEGQSSNYCLFVEAKKYCAQTGQFIKQSPACIWAQMRPSSCLTDPEHLSCLYAATADGLTLSCKNFPNDPLCKAHDSGRIVVAGGSESADDNAESAGASSLTMGDLLGSSNNSSMGDSGGSMWSTSSAAIQQACQQGLLLDCQ